MNPTIASRVVLASMALVLHAALPAWGADTAPAQTLRFWQCMIDLDAAGLQYPTTVTETELLTTLTTKQCPGNTSTSGGTAAVRIDCNTEDPIPGWSGSAKKATGFACTIFRQNCGLPDEPFWVTFDTQLNVDGGGFAKLSCTCDPTSKTTPCEPCDFDDPNSPCVEGTGG